MQAARSSVCERTNSERDGSIPERRRPGSDARRERDPGFGPDLAKRSVAPSALPEITDEIAKEDAEKAKYEEGIGRCKKHADQTPL